MKLLVTGAAGFIGSHLADCLLADEPSVSIEEGVERFVAWFGEHEERLV